MFFGTDIIAGGVGALEEGFTCSYKAECGGGEHRSPIVYDRGVRCVVLTHRTGLLCVGGGTGAECEGVCGTGAGAGEECGYDTHCASEVLSPVSVLRHDVRHRPK